MLIGVDFDNTIAGYDDLFVAIAFEEGLLKCDTVRTKRHVRDQIREQPNGEIKWMRLQSLIYGVHMNRANLIDGCGEFFEFCRNREIQIRIVSHKTEYGHFNTNGVNLRTAALEWLEKKMFFGSDAYGLSVSDVYFESTREEKIKRINSLECTHFVDDLEEVFTDLAFPLTTSGYLLANGAEGVVDDRYAVCDSWLDIGVAIFGADYG